jgi:hypothetical protein
VIHVHHKEKWNSLLNHAATTASDTAYGTPEMAYAIQDLIRGNKVGNHIIVMGGHDEGLIFFGNTLEEATRIILEQI